ncbi:MAG: NAD(P)/FAD-dependent oxidoreductase [Spirochaetaceae bacterium]|nr:MAG: NAD(P)/FAD-dependent oxidoreductase [Spirochaetaceae bacterium]
MQRVTIVGAGVAGLSAGIYAARNGFQTTIIEQHRVPGGLCTGWNRTIRGNRYTVEGCMHYVLGLTKGAFRTMWDELGIDRNVEPVTELFTIGRAPQRRTIHGRTAGPRRRGDESISVCADAREIGRRMLDRSPADRRAIERLVRDIELFAGYDLPVDTPAEIAPFRRITTLVSRLGAAYGAFLARFAATRLTSTRSYARRFRDPLLRWCVARMGGYPDYPAAWTLFVLSRFHRGEAGFPHGGSLGLGYDMEEQFLRLGGTIRYGAAVRGLESQKGRVTGVVLADGSVVNSDAVICAGDLATATRWAAEAGIGVGAQQRMVRRLSPATAVAQVSLAVRRVASPAEPVEPTRHRSRVIYPSGSDGGALCGPQVSRIVLRDYGADPIAAPDGSNLITCQFETDFARWSDLGRKSSRYRTAKEALAERAVDLVRAVWPDLIGPTTVVDVSTPLTTERYTANTGGSVQGFRPDRRGFAYAAQYRARHGSGLYFAGHWLCPGGGIHRAAQSGRYAVRLLCRDTGARPATSQAGRSSRRSTRVRVPSLPLRR